MSDSQQHVQQQLQQRGPSAADCTPQPPNADAMTTLAGAATMYTTGGSMALSAAGSGVGFGPNPFAQLPSEFEPAATAGLPGKEFQIGMSTESAGGRRVPIGQILRTGAPIDVTKTQLHVKMLMAPDVVGGAMPTATGMGAAAQVAAAGGPVQLAVVGERSFPYVAMGMSPDAAVKSEFVSFEPARFYVSLCRANVVVREQPHVFHIEVVHGTHDDSDWAPRTLFTISKSDLSMPPNVPMYSTTRTFA